MIKDLLISIYHVPQNCVLRVFSGMGYHLWIKLKPFTALKRAFDLKIDLEEEVKAFNLSIEVFPKQGNMTNKKFGNCCKLPLSLNLKNGEFCEILDGFDLSQQGFGYEIPYWIPSANTPLDEKKRKNGRKEVIFTQRSVSDQQDLNYYISKLKPCLKGIITGEIISHKHSSGNGHYMNICLCNALLGLGAPIKTIISAYQNQPDFDPCVTRCQVKSLEKGFSPKFANVSCKTIQKKGFCLNESCHLFKRS